MSANPYESTISPASLPPERTTRAPWVAVLLGLLMTPMIAMLYVARPRRALAYLVVMIAGVVLTVYAGGGFALNPVLFMAGFELAFRVAGALDARRLARAWHGGELPWYARMPGVVGAFVVLQLVMLSIRSFGIESFRIASNSMAPTLATGDLVLVDKTAYGWSVPISDERFLRFEAPRRGDIAVFRVPETSGIDAGMPFVMRVVGLPGERIGYTNDRVVIDGVEQPLVEQGSVTVGDETLTRFEETLGDVRHSIGLRSESPAYARGAGCDEAEDGNCVVPAGHYYVMGDNRHNSRDSRFIGTIPEERFVGRVTYVWRSAGGARSVDGE